MPSVAPIPPTLTNNLRRIGLLRLADDLNDVIARATKGAGGLTRGLGRRRDR